MGVPIIGWLSPEGQKARRAEKLLRRRQDALKEMEHVAGTLHVSDHALQREKIRLRIAEMDADVKRAEAQRVRELQAYQPTCKGDGGTCLGIVEPWKSPYCTWHQRLADGDPMLSMHDHPTLVAEADPDFLYPPAIN